MKHFYIKCILLCLLAFISYNMYAYDFKMNGIFYNITSTKDLTVGITYSSNSGYNYKGDVIIPETVVYDGKTYRVTSIDEGAFYVCPYLTSVSIPNSVTSIGNYAFQDCSSLTTVTIPNSVTSIGGWAFSRCTGLTSMKIGNSVTSIGSSAFSRCTGLTSMKIGNSVTSIGSSAFKDCSGLISLVVDNGNPVYDSREDCNAVIQTSTNTLIAGCSKTVIPNSVTSIGNYAFQDCSSLTTVTIPNSVTSIGGWAFSRCTGLTSMKIGNSVTSIGSSAFSGCSGLTSLTIPSSVTDIGIYAFDDCSGLVSIIVDEDNPIYDSREDCNAIITTATNTLFRGCAQTIVPNSITSIGSHAFYGCTGLISVTIPNSVTSIGNYAFQRCSRLTSVTIPNSVTSIGKGAFFGCSGLTSVTIPNSVTSIGNSAFYSCDELASITVKQATPTDISSDVFSEKTYQLGTLYVPIGREQYYKDAIGWNNYVHIEGIDMPDVETSDSPFDNVGSNQMILGYYRTDECRKLEGVGGPKGTYKVCIGFDKEKIEPFIGNKITYVRFALVNTNITDAKIWISNTRDGNALYTQRVPSLTTEWNEVKLDTPFEIMNDSIFIGLEYYQDESNYPNSYIYISTGAEKGSFYIYGPYGDDGNYKWIDSNEDNLSIQCLIEGDKIPEYDIHTTGVILRKQYIKVGEKVSGWVSLRNWGKKGVGSCEMSCQFDGMEFETVSINLSGRADTNYDLEFSYTPQNITAGKHTISCTVKTINGESPKFTADDTQSIMAKIYANDIGRQKELKEMYTATWCPNSMRLLKGLKEEMAQECDDVAYVLIHCSDVLSCDAGDAYGIFTEWIPTIYNNRYTWPGMNYLRDGSIEAMPSFANVNISADYNDKTRQLMIKVSGERNEEFELLEEYTNLTVLLTEDDVVARQYDGGNGKYIYDFKHQAVLRTNVSAVWGDSVVWDGDKYEMNYTVTLDDGWEKDNMKIVAFLAKPFNGSNYDEIYVVNCNDFAVKDATSVDIVDLMASEVGPFDVYSLSGVLIKQKVTSTKGLLKGVYIVNGKKVLVNQ